MKDLTTLFSYLTPKSRMPFLGALFAPVFLLSMLSLNSWSEGDHEHEHEAKEQHAPHHEDGDHDKHEDHVDHNEGKHDHDEHGRENDGEENSSRINSDMAQQVGIVTANAGSQELHQTITVYGNVVSGPEQLSHVRARFEGLVKSIQVTIGDTVKTDDVLAEIESNESLKIYKIRSPISGRVVQRHANSGEVTQDQILFSIANFDTVWAELRVYPTHQSSVAEDQSVHVLTTNGRVESRVKHVVPSMDAPYQLARVKLDIAGMSCVSRSTRSPSRRRPRGASAPTRPGGSPARTVRFRRPPPTPTDVPRTSRAKAPTRPGRVGSRAPPGAPPCSSCGSPWTD